MLCVSVRRNDAAGRGAAVYFSIAIRGYIVNITTQWLEKRNACPDAVQWVDEQPDKNEFVLIDAAMRIDRFDWAIWYISQRLNKRDRVKLTVFAARQILIIYEKNHPDDNRPRKAIESAERYIKKQSLKNKKSAAAAAYAASAAVYTAAVYAADVAAGHAASAAVYAAAAAAYDAADAAASAYDDAAAAYAKLKKGIIDYGVSLIKGGAQ